MDCLKSITSLGTHGYDQPWDKDYKAEKGSLQVRYVVVYDDSGNKYKTSPEATDTQVYRTYLDPKTGYLRNFVCPLGIVLRGLVYIPGSILRPAVILGAECADVILTGELKILVRVEIVGRACLYSISMTFCAVGMVMFPYVTYFMVKLSQLEFAANRGVHYTQSLRRPEEKDKFVYYLTGAIQPRGHVCQMRGGGRKYKPEHLARFDENKYVIKSSTGENVTAPFSIDLKPDDKGTLLIAGKRYRTEHWGRNLSGCDKIHTDRAIETLAKFTVSSPGFQPLKLTYISDKGFHFEEVDGYNYSPFSDGDKPIYLSQEQKIALKDLAIPFITIKDKMTLEETWRQIRVKINRVW
ncbi:MAG: hypothetical protein H7A39_05485 [Chlamydiales bacterium]|nr:hypothetical protein [Chlamydiales bacterium]